MPISGTMIAQTLHLHATDVVLTAHKREIEAQPHPKYARATVN